jgi:hypothetical protein
MSAVSAWELFETIRPEMEPGYPRGSGARNFSSQNIQTGSGGHPAYHSVGTRDKAAGA